MKIPQLEAFFPLGKAYLRNVLYNMLIFATDEMAIPSRYLIQFENY